MHRHLLSLALGHEAAGIAVREQASLSTAQAASVLRTLGADPEVSGALVLATCGRTEVHVSGVHLARLRGAILDALAAVHGDTLTAYADLLVERQDRASARHLFRVAAGLESALLGESQVLGQLRAAIRLARAEGALDSMVGGTADRAVAAARRARRESGLGRGAASVGQAAVALLRDSVGEVAGRSVLVVGAGEVGSLAARALSAAGAELLVASRTEASADALSREAGGRTVALGGLARVLEFADAAVFSAATGRPLLGAADLGEISRRREGRGLLILDLAVPRNVAPEAGSLPGIRLVNVDELGAAADAGLRRRRRAAALADTLLEEELDDWSDWAQGSKTAPTLAALAAYADGIRAREVDRTLRALGEVDPRLRRRIESLSQSLVSKLMLHPIAYVRSHPDEEEARALLQRMFSEPPTG